MAEQKKSLSPLAWIGIGCGGLLLIGIVVVSVGGYFAAKTASDFIGDSPAAAAAEALVRINPELELVDSDREAGTITIREKATGKEVTVNYSQLERGELVFGEGQGSDGTTLDETKLMLKGVRFDDLQVGPRDQDRRAPIAATVTNTTDVDIPGMQVGFVASDEDGEMGPFWIPQMLGEESRWALKAGETKVLTDAIVGFGNRDVRNAKPVDIRLLGENVKEVANRPEAERREIFLEIGRCEADAEQAALKKHPENFNLPGSQQLELMKQRNEMSGTLSSSCRDRVVAARGLTVPERRLISGEGVMKSWPPLGSN